MPQGTATRPAAGAGGRSRGCEHLGLGVYTLGSVYTWWIQVLDPSTPALSNDRLSALSLALYPTSLVVRGLEGP